MFSEVLVSEKTHEDLQELRLQDSVETKIMQTFASTAHPKHCSMILFAVSLL